MKAPANMGFTESLDAESVESSFGLNPLNPAPALDLTISTVVRK